MQLFHDNKKDTVSCFIFTLPSSSSGFYPHAHIIATVPQTTYMSQAVGKNNEGQKVIDN